MKLAFIGDDFTGSTDALGQLAAAGLRARLLLRLPDAGIAADIAGLDAVGISSTARSLAPAAMREELLPLLRFLHALNPQYIHYKICSTFDSSPHCGNIGAAIDAGAEVCGSEWIPLLVGTPELGRFCVFGNLFARSGIGTGGTIHRLDRHPSMREHPVTPASESDLRIHLATQTTRPSLLIDVLDLELPDSVLLRRLQHVASDCCPIVLFDTLSAAHLRAAGEVLRLAAPHGKPLFCVGSSAVESALFPTVGKPVPATPLNPVDAGALLILCASRSPVTREQIVTARAAGFGCVRVDMQKLLLPDYRDLAIRDAIDQALREIQHRNNLVIHTGLLDAPVACAGSDAQLPGIALGKIATALVDKANIRRIVIAGGDSSGHACRELDIHALDTVCPFVPGAPLCRAIAANKVNGMEIILKGGQVGSSDFFMLAAGDQFSVQNI